MAKGYEELRRQYRELDRDCALLSRFWLDGKQKKSKIFLPTEEHMRQAWSRVEELKKRMEELEEPDRVFSLIKHHFKDFLDSLEYTLKDKEEHPECRSSWDSLGNREYFPIEPASGRGTLPGAARLSTRDL